MGRACGREHCVSLLLVNCMLYTLISTYICQRLLLLLLLLGGSVKHAVCIALTVALNPGMESPAALRAASPRPPWSRTPPGDLGDREAQALWGPLQKALLSVLSVSCLHVLFSF